MNITLNGNTRQISAGTTLEEIISQTVGSPIPAGVAVAVNYELIKRTDWQDTILEKGDEIEILWASAGG